MKRPPGAPCFCGQIECVCALVAGHEKTCRFRISVLCPVAIECDHGYDVCPTCDACTCEEQIDSIPEELADATPR